MSLSYHYICLAWTGEYESLKKFLSEDLKLIGIWEQPGGDKKVFKTRNISISWRKSKSLLYIEGPEADKITQLLCSKITENLNSVSGNNTISSSDCLCQTEADISKYNDLRCDIKELKANQNASKEAIQALSGTVDLIAETLAHIQENIHVKTNQKGMLHVGKQCSLHESLQEFDMQESFNEHNSIETIRIIEATNCASPKANNTLSQINTNSDSHLNNEVELIEIIEPSTSTDPKERHVATKQSNLNSITQSKNSTTQSKNSATQPKKPTQKHLVPCPYLRKKGHCLKGSRCDFSHQFDPQQAFKPYRPYNVQPLFKDNIPSYPLPGFPPVMNLPTFQSYMNYPTVYIPPSTGPPQFNRIQHPQMNYPALYPPPLMAISTRHPQF